MTQTPFIELQNITYHHRQDREPLLNNLNWKIDDKHLGLIGPNGCGKTTLLRIMVGLTKPTSGTILFQGIPLTSQKDFTPLRKKTGFLFQHSDDQLFSPTVLEDVAFGPLNLGCTPEEAIEIARSTLNRLGLNGFEERITHRLSGGEKKLVALATVIAMKPSLLLLDEPTNNLDPTTQARLIEILQDLNLPSIIISHDWDFLHDTTSALYTIEHGHIHECDEAHIHEHKHIHAYGNQPHQHKH